MEFIFSLNTQLNNTVPTYIRADRQRLKQVLINLTNNAIKYNNEGGEVTTSVDIKQTSEDGYTPIRISVTDTGWGIDEKDLEITFLRSSGPGGQNVNKLETAVRIKHLPTGITVTCQSERYQHQNREKALEILKTKPYQLELEKQAKDISSNRKHQIGTGERAEKIRTYNFPQDRITDHRLNKSFSNISRILNGELEIILQEFEKQENLTQKYD